MAIGLLVAVAYVAAAWLGFQFAFVAEQVTTVWAPSGIAIAALLRWGTRLWPAIWIGAFLANAGSHAPLWSAMAVASGNTLEAVAASVVLGRFAFDARLPRLRDVVLFTSLGAGLSTTISATIGATTLCVAAVQPWDRFAPIWRDWWLGDAVGALVVAPLLLTLARSPRGRRAVDVETVLLASGTVVATAIVFGSIVGATAAYHPLAFIVFPFVIVTAVRRGQPATGLVILLATAVALWHTVRGDGPFAGAEVHLGLILLQTYVAVLAGTGMLLAAAITERLTGERRRAAASAVADVLAGARDMTTAAPRLLRGLAENLEWPTAALWLADASDGRLRCLEVWSGTPARTEAFVEATRQRVFEAGVGLPGRVLSSGRPVWIENVVEDANFPRAPLARAAGLRAAVAFPICLGDRVLGVIECFHRQVMPPDPDLLRTLGTVGNQIGQFIGRLREQSAVLEAQRRTAAILDTALDAIIGIDHRGLVTEFNQAATRMFGRPREQAIGAELAALIIPAALREAHRAGLARYLATGVGPFIDQRIETLAVHASGHEFPVEVAITRVAGAEPAMFTGVVRDLTDRVAAEKEREQLLQREAQSRSEAEAANRAKDEFLATLSHELRTPLNAIVGWVGMMRDGTLDAATTVRALEVIDRNARLLVHLVADILDVSRIITGGLRLDIQPVDLGLIVHAALDAVRPAADGKRIQLGSSVTAAAALTLGDAARLQQVVWNLLSNAVRFTDPGGTVHVEVRDAGEMLEISVADDGAGIDPAFLPFVFERFRQGSSPNMRHGGLGLGLAIVRHLVELHGGTVRADSEGPGRGARFTVRLPRRPGVAAPPAHAALPL